MSRKLTIESEWIYKGDPLLLFNEATDRVISVKSGFDSSGRKSSKNFGYRVYFLTPIKEDENV